MEFLLQEKILLAIRKKPKYVIFELNKNKIGQYQCVFIVTFGTVTTFEELKYHVLIKLKLRNKKLKVKFKVDFQ